MNAIQAPPEMPSQPESPTAGGRNGTTRPDPPRRTCCTGSWLAALVLATAALFVPPAGAAMAQAGDWQTPLPRAEVLRSFEKPPQNWLPGHRGVDLSAEPGQDVLAPAAGTVHFTGTVAGRPVLTLRIGGRLSSVEPVVGEVTRGETVEQGQIVGKVSRGHQHCAAHGCVHWGVREAGDYIDPLSLLTEERRPILLPESERPEPAPPPAEDSTAGGWGGHRNGRIPAQELCPLRHAPHHRLRCDAAEGFEQLNTAFKGAFGRNISVTDAYRDYDSQVRLKRVKGHMAATPGTSNHGWGLALDLGGGINRFGTPEHSWMRTHGPRYGWVHPPWAQAGGSLPEPWHWEWGR